MIDAFINGDCMEYLHEYPDGFFDLAIVDPPYGEKVRRGGYMTNKISGGVARRKEYHASLWGQGRPGKEYFDQLRRVSKNQIIWGGNYFADILEPSAGWIVWDKRIPNGVHYADCELAWTSFDKALKKFEFQWSGMLQGDMKHKEKRIHPTQKPVALYRWLLENYAEEGDTILDTHVGSASSLIACMQTGHPCTGYEVDPVYYADAQQRIAEAEKSIKEAAAQMTIFDFMGA